MITRFFTSGAHWAGILVATLALAPIAMGLPAWVGWLMAPLGYLVGFYLAGRWLGFPRLQRQHWDALAFEDQGEPLQAMRKALAVIRELVDDNPDARLSTPLQTRLSTLCTHIDQLIDLWARQAGMLPPEESFLARHIVLRYLPDALSSYLAIAPKLAQTQPLGNGRTAEDTLYTTLAQLQAKVQQLTDDLAAQDAQAFLNHSRFLHEKFGQANGPLQGLGQSALTSRAKNKQK